MYCIFNIFVLIKLPAFLFLCETSGHPLTFGLTFNSKDVLKFAECSLSRSLYPVDDTDQACKISGFCSLLIYLPSPLSLFFKIKNGQCKTQSADYRLQKGGGEGSYKCRLQTRGKGHTADQNLNLSIDCISFLIVPLMT